MTNAMTLNMLTDKDLKAAERRVKAADKACEKAIDALRRIEDGPAWKRAAAYVIVRKDDANQWGRMKVARSANGMGPLHVFLWSPAHEEGLQHGSARDCGYDKLAAALNGLMFDGVKLKDSEPGWEAQLREAGWIVIQAA